MLDPESFISIPKAIDTTLDIIERFTNGNKGELKEAESHLNKVKEILLR